MHDGRVVIADTYNHKIKLLDPANAEGVDAGRHRNARPHRDGYGRKAQFYEPGGVSVVGGTIFVADTNNHVDPRGGCQDGGDGDDPGGIGVGAEATELQATGSRRVTRVTPRSP